MMTKSILLLALLLAGCKTGEEKDSRPFTLTSENFSVRLTNPDDNRIDRLTNRLGDIPMSALLGGTFDRFALLTVRNDSSKLLHLYTLSDVIPMPILSMRKEKTHEQLDVLMDLSWNFGGLKKMHTLGKGDTATLYLPYCRTYRHPDVKENHPAIDRFHFDLDYSFGLKPNIDSVRHRLKGLLAIDSTDNAELIHLRSVTIDR